MRSDADEALKALYRDLAPTIGGAMYSTRPMQHSRLTTDRTLESRAGAASPTSGKMVT